MSTNMLNENNFICKNSEKSGISYFSKSLSCLVSWKTGVSSWLLLLHCEFLVKIYEENLALHRYEIRKGRNTLMVFSDDLKYSVILHQNSTNGSLDRFRLQQAI